MTRAIIPVCLSFTLLCACGNGTTSDTSQAETMDPVSSARSTKPQSPIQISYRIIGQAIVGQPVAIDLQFESTLESQSFDVSYRVNDATALQFPESQPLELAVSPSRIQQGRALAAQQVAVIPLREGRLYLNVEAQIETDAGSFSSVTAVPIQVGQAPRELTDNGVVTTDENGELIRTLPAKEN